MKFSETTLTKARKLVRSGRIERDAEHSAIWWVTSENRSKVYRVQSDFDRRTRRLSWVTCTCPHGLATGAGAAFCYHVAGVLMKMRDEQTVEGVAPDVLMDGFGGTTIGPKIEETDSE